MSFVYGTMPIHFDEQWTMKRAGMWVLYSGTVVTCLNEYAAYSSLREEERSIAFSPSTIRLTSGASVAIFWLDSPNRFLSFWTPWCAYFAESEV